MAITIDSGNPRRPGRMPAVAVARVTQRARAFVAARRHSRVVALLRILFPLVAIGTLAVYGMIVAITWSASHGKFKVKDTPAREGRNPSTGATIQIAASRKLTFAAAKAVKDKLNG